MYNISTVMKNLIKIPPPQKKRTKQKGKKIMEELKIIRLSNLLTMSVPPLGN